MKANEPQTPEQWQEAVDAAAACRAIADCAMYGLIEGRPGDRHCALRRYPRPWRSARSAALDVAARSRDRDDREHQRQRPPRFMNRSSHPIAGLATNNAKTHAAITSQSGGLSGTFRFYRQRSARSLAPPKNLRERRQLFRLERRAVPGEDRIVYALLVGHE